MIETAPVDDIERISYAANEIQRRGNLRALERLNHQIVCRGLIVYPWLTQAREALSLLNPIANKEYQACVYVIARSGYVEDNGVFGVYVGQTSRTPEERCQEHLTPGHPALHKVYPYTESAWCIR